MPKAFQIFILLFAWGVLAGTGPAAGQTTRAATAPAEKSIRLNFPTAVDLRVLVEYVSRQIGMNVLYDQELEKQTVSITSPSEIAPDSLLPFLQSVLRQKGLALVDAEVPGWKRIIPVAEVSEPVTVEFVPVKNADAAALAQQVKQIVAAKQKLESPASPRAGVEVSVDPRNNQLVIIGPPAAVADAVAVAKPMDVPLPEEQSPIRFYKLANTTAADVLDTILSLQSEGESPGDGAAGSYSAAGGAIGGVTPTTGLPSASARRTPGQGAAGSSAPLETQRPGSARDSGALPLTQGSTRSTRVGLEERDVSSLAPPAGSVGRSIPSAADGLAPAPPRLALRTQDATVTADPNTNTIIVVGGPAVQRQYEHLINMLDKRRPQVLLEATVVTVDTQNDFSLGVEIAARGEPGDTQIITFSSFGLSTVDPTTGRLGFDSELGQTALLPSAGLNAAVLSADVADLVLKALATNSRSRVVASPRILVNDNATGVLFSIAESPFTSLNAGETISTTSFAGYAEAGTEITLTPHISEKDYLQLEYVVALSSFTGRGLNGIPPPRQTDKVASRVTIPDGSTIVVGGLNQAQASDAVSAVPLLGQIPILKYLFSSRTKSDTSRTLFVFIRPVILRDDEFADLKLFSERDRKSAAVADGFPASEPLLIE